MNWPPVSPIYRHSLRSYPLFLQFWKISCHWLLQSSGNPNRFFFCRMESTVGNSCAWFFCRLLIWTVMEELMNLNCVTFSRVHTHPLRTWISTVCLIRWTWIAEDLLRMVSEVKFTNSPFHCWLFSYTIQKVIFVFQCASVWNESKCKNLLMEVSLTCMKMNL